MPVAQCVSSNSIALATAREVAVEVVIVPVAG